MPMDPIDRFSASREVPRTPGAEDRSNPASGEGSRALPADGFEISAEAMSQLLSLREPPTAVYAHSDEVALGAIRTLRRAGLRIPEDISVIGIDDHPLAELTDLTTVSQPVRQQGLLAGQMLLGLLQGDNVERAVTMPTRLVIRQSTAPPRTARVPAR